MTPENEQKLQHIKDACNKVGSKQKGATGGKLPEKPKRGGKTECSQPLSTETPQPIQAFFASFAPRFQHNPTASSSKEFYRLCNVFGWHREHPERQRAYQNFQNALVLQFNETYGTNVNSLATWQNLCDALRIYPIPDDLETCREAVRGPFVNLVDLVDAKATGIEVELFVTEHKLREYTLSTGKFFPRGNAQAGRVLRSLLQRPGDGAFGNRKDTRRRR